MLITDLTAIDHEVAALKGDLVVTRVAVGVQVIVVIGRRSPVGLIERKVKKRVNDIRISKVYGTVHI